MMMRYTHYGIGHPIAVRELIRDCANAAELADNSSHLQDENDEDEVIPYSDNNSEEGESDEDETEDKSDDEEFDDLDPECGEMEEEEEEEEEDDHLSF